MQCFTMLRTLGASARHHVKHAVHHRVAHHVHRAHHMIAHAVIRPVPFPAMVCMVAGLTAAGVGGLVAKGMAFAPDASQEGTPLASTPALNVAGEIGSAWASLSSSHPTEIGGLPVPPSSFDLNELGSPPVLPSSFDWNELGSPLVLPPSLFDWKEVDSPANTPYSLDLSGPDSVQVPAGRPAEVVEPSSTSALATGLVVLAILIRCNKAVGGRIDLRQQLRQIGQCRDCVIRSVAEFFGASAHHAKNRGGSISAAADPSDLETEGLGADCVEAV
jgi:hypothetical protein